MSPENLFRIMTLRRCRGLARPDFLMTSEDDPHRAIFRPPTSHADVPCRHPCRRGRVTADKLFRETRYRLPAPENLFRIMMLRRYRGFARADFLMTSEDDPPRAILRPPTSPADVPAGTRADRRGRQPTNSSGRSVTVCRLLKTYSGS